MKANLSFLVTLNLFQGPWSDPIVTQQQADTIGPWMLKQVQHDEFGANTDA